MGKLEMMWEEQKKEELKKKKEEIEELRIEEELDRLHSTNKSIYPGKLCVDRFIQRDLDLEKDVFIYEGHRDWVPTTIYNAMDYSVGLILPYVQIVTNLNFNELMANNFLECEDETGYIYLPTNLFAYFKNIASIEIRKQVISEIKKARKELKELENHRDVVKRKQDAEKNNQE